MAVVYFMLNVEEIVNLTDEELDEYAQFMKDIILKTSGIN
jgi:hypothetical protein